MQYYIASLKHTNKDHEHILWWGPDSRGYTPVVGPYIGEYDDVQAAKRNDGMDYIAVPVEMVKPFLLPEPFTDRGHKFYDQPGPVVANTRKNWNSLIAASLLVGRPDGVKPMPEVHRGASRAVYERAELEVSRSIMVERARG